MEFPEMHLYDPRQAVVEEIHRLELGIAEQVAQSGQHDETMVKRRDQLVASLADVPVPTELTQAQKDLIAAQEHQQALDEQERVRIHVANSEVAIGVAQAQAEQAQIDAQAALENGDEELALALTAKQIDKANAVSELEAQRDKNIDITVQLQAVIDANAAAIEAPVE